jgi:hypothetical protein
MKFTVSQYLIPTRLLCLDGVKHAGVKVSPNWWNSGFIWCWVPHALPRTNIWNRNVQQDNKSDLGVSLLFTSIPRTSLNPSYSQLDSRCSDLTSIAPSGDQNLSHLWLVVISSTQTSKPYPNFKSQSHSKPSPPSPSQSSNRRNGKVKESHSTLPSSKSC